MPPDSKVYVRFYVQPRDPVNSKPIEGRDSTLIGTDELLPIPPFNHQDNAPLNSVLAGVTFDTTPDAGQYLAFWVVTWMQDKNNKLAEELTGHGLKRIPGELKSLSDVEAEPCSNNAGFYKRLFYVMPGQKSGESSSPARGRKAARGAVQISCAKSGK